MLVAVQILIPTQLRHVPLFVNQIEPMQIFALQLAILLAKISVLPVKPGNCLNQNMTENVAAVSILSEEK